jgi:hypothetical protein
MNFLSCKPVKRKSLQNDILYADTKKSHFRSDLDRIVVKMVCLLS